MALLINIVSTLRHLKSASEEAEDSRNAAGRAQSEMLSAALIAQGIPEALAKIVGIIGQLKDTTHRALGALTLSSTNTEAAFAEFDEATTKGVDHSNLTATSLNTTAEELGHYSSDVA